MKNQKKIATVANSVRSSVAKLNAEPEAKNYDSVAANALLKGRTNLDPSRSRLNSGSRHFFTSLVSKMLRVKAESAAKGDRPVAINSLFGRAGQVSSRPRRRRRSPGSKHF